jgi:hypothetical protein
VILTFSPVNRKERKMPIITSDNKAHAATCQAAEMSRQVSVSAAGGNAASIRSAEIIYYRAVVASCVANGLPSTNFEQALRDLGCPGGV